MLLLAYYSNKNQNNVNIMYSNYKEIASRYSVIIEHF